MLRTRLSTTLVCVTLTTGVAEVRAAQPTASSPLVSPTVELNLRVDATVLGGALLLTGALELGNWYAGGAACRWCDRDDQGRDSLNGFDAAVRDKVTWRDISRAQLFSNIAIFSLLPVGTLWSWVAPDRDFSRRARLTEAYLIVESIAVALLADEIAKFSVRRERPFVHTLAPDDKAHTDKPWDNNTSFYSGHSTFSFALVSSATTLARLRNSRWTWAIGATGGTLAALVAYLRLAGGKHYATDVLVGAGAGTLCGISVPLLHRTSTDPVKGTTGMLSAGPEGPRGIWTLRWTQTF